MPLLLVLLILISGSTFRSLAFTSNDVQTVHTAFRNAFFVLNGTNGWFKNTQTSSSNPGSRTYFWGQAEEIECVIDAYEWTSNVTYKIMITNLLNGFKNNEGTNWSYNPYNDDIMWAVLAFSRGYLVTGRSQFRDIAKFNYDMCYARGWDTSGVVPPAGGFFWTTANNSKNSAVNFPAANAAYTLYRCLGDASYLTKATNTFSWGRSNLFNAANGQIYDSLSSQVPTTYNQGTFIGIADSLGRVADATLAANYTMNSMTSGGILPQYGIDQNNSGFNAIFIRWMARFMKNRNLQSTYEPWLQHNANAAWNRRRLADNLSWCQWREQSPVGINFHSWDCISSYEAVVAVVPTQSASPGTVTLLANDASGVSSFNSAGNWSDGAAPSWTNNYVVEGFELRTPANSSSHYYRGSALVATNGGAVRLTTTGGGVITIGTELSLNSAIVSAFNRPAFLGGYIVLGPQGGVFDPQGVGGFTVTANLAGPGSLTVATDNNTFGGTLYLSGFNTYTGGTIINGPYTLTLTNGGTLGSSSGDLIFENSGDGLTIPHAPYLTANYGTLNLNGSNMVVGNLTGGGGRIVNNGSGTAKLTIGNGNKGGGDFQGVIMDRTVGTGILAVVKTGTNTITFSGTNTYTGGTTISTGTLQLGDEAARNGVIAGNLTNNAALVIANPWLQSFGGMIAGTGSLTKRGNGRLNLSGLNIYTGNTAIMAGTLALNGTGSFSNTPMVLLSEGATLDVNGLAAGTLVLQSGQTLNGGGNVDGNLTVLTGAMVNPGESIGTLTVQGDIVLSGQLTMELNRTNTQNSDRVVSVNGTIIGGGTLIVTNIGPPLEAGDTFQLFNGAVSGFASVMLPPVNPPNAWLNRLTFDGSLKVVPPVSTTETNIVIQVTGNTLMLSWPDDHLGWRLQAQTNVIGEGIGTNWFDVVGSTNVSEVTMPVNSDVGSIFYRLTYP